MRYFNNHAVTELFSFIIILMIATTSISVLTFWGVPYMEDKKAQARLDSALLQFDALVETIDAKLSESVGEIYGVSGFWETIISSTTMRFALESNCILKMDYNRERFVFYTSIFDYQGIEDHRFSYEVKGFEPDDTNDLLDQKFNIAVEEVKDDYLLPINCDFVLKDINGTYIDTFTVTNGLTIGQYEITFTPLNALSGAVKIEIINYNTGGQPGEINDYLGVIWIFDIGSIIFETPSSSGYHRAIVENGGVISATSTGTGYFYKNPASFTGEYLDGNKMLAFRVVNITRDNYYAVDQISGTKAVPVNLYVKSNESIIDSTNGITRLPFYDFFNIKIYGETKVVDTWWFYYNQTYGFKDDYIDPIWTEKALRLEGKLAGGIPLGIFSLNFVNCTIGMEVDV